MRRSLAAVILALALCAPAASVWAYCALPSADTWIEIGSPANALTLGDDDAATFFWPLTFDFFGTTYNYVTIGSNGIVALQSSTPFPDPPPPNAPGATSPNNVTMPDASAPDAFVAPFWDDLNPAAGGTVYAAGVGISMQPQRLVVQWDAVPHNAAGGAVTFQVWLEDVTDEVVFCYEDVNFGNPAFDAGASATVGIEDAGAAASVLYSFNTASLADNTCVRFYQTCPCADADGDGFSPTGGACGPVDCDDGNAAVNPGAAEVPGNGLDDDCNAATPDCVDADGDGWSPTGGACGPIDCDDANAAVSPGAPEIPGNGIDDNCDSIVCGSIPQDGASGGALALWGGMLAAVGGLVLLRRRRA